MNCFLIRVNDVHLHILTWVRDGNAYASQYLLCCAPVRCM